MAFTRMLTAAFVVVVLSVAYVHVSSAASKPMEAASATVGKDGKYVRIVFKDGKDLVVVMNDTEAVQFDPPTISADRRTVVWTEEMQIAASYPDAESVYVYRDGKPLNFLSADGMRAGMDPCPDGGAVKDWQFYANGRQLYVACGFPHGQPDEYRNLYDLCTGKSLGKVNVSNKTNEPALSAPAWARSDPH